MSLHASMASVHKRGGAGPAPVPVSPLPWREPRTPRQASAVQPHVGVRVGPEPGADGQDRVRLRVDCLLPMPADQVLMRRLAVELRNAHSDPERVLRLALRLLADEAEPPLPAPMSGHGACRPAMAAMDPAAPAPGAISNLHRLTPRERRVAQLAMEGLRNKEIARRLCRSVRTIECQISSVLRKLKLGSRAQLIRLREGE